MSLRALYKNAALHASIVTKRARYNFIRLWQTLGKFPKKISVYLNLKHNGEAVNSMEGNFSNFTVTR